MNQKKPDSEEYESLKVAVVIPIYKSFEKLSSNEIQALIQIRTILIKRDIFFVYPSYVDPAKYVRLLHPAQATAVRLDDKYFGSQDSSNRMLLSYEVYWHFNKYDYMLVHHIDAFVFSDQLNYWCSQGFDYVGAPWFEGNHNPRYPLKFKGVGNGGFSLRKISSFLKITKNRPLIRFHRTLYKLYDFLDGQNHTLLRKVLGVNFLMRHMKPYVGFEDEFWGLIAPRFYKWFKVAQPEIALKFSFEVLPKEMIKLNNDKLPFGCHAWEKFDPAFWEPYIHSTLQDHVNFGDRSKEQEVI